MIMMAKMEMCVKVEMHLEGVSTKHLEPSTKACRVVRPLQQGPFTVNPCQVDPGPSAGIPPTSSSALPSGYECSSQPLYFNPPHCC